DIYRGTEGDFAMCNAQIQGMYNYKGETLELQFQNEHLMAKSGDRLLCVTPDLIAVLDDETGMPITTEGLRYGARCVVIGMPCNEKWRTDNGIVTCSPSYFGYDVHSPAVESPL